MRFGTGVTEKRAVKGNPIFFFCGDFQNVNKYFREKRTVQRTKIVKNGKEIYFYATNPKFESHKRYSPIAETSTR